MVGNSKLFIHLQSKQGVNNSLGLAEFVPPVDIPSKVPGLLGSLDEL